MTERRSRIPRPRDLSSYLECFGLEFVPPYSCVRAGMLRQGLGDSGNSLLSDLSHH